MPESKSIEYEWVAGKYYGDEAKHVSGLASNGIGYQRLSTGTDGGGAFIIVAFVRSLAEPRPHHLNQIIDPAKIRELEKKRLPNQQEDRRRVRV